MFPDENAFYRNMAELLLGEKTVETALHEALLFMRSFFPVDIMYLSVFDPVLIALISIRVDEGDGVRRINRTVPFDKKAIEHFLNPESPDPVFVAGASHPGTAATIRHNRRWKEYSGLAGRLVKGDILGSIVIYGMGQDRYSPQNLKLFNASQSLFASVLFEAVHNDAYLRLKERAVESAQPDKSYEVGSDEVTLIGKDTGLLEVAELAHQVAQFDSSVIITGETGVGKEILARIIHRESSRSTGPFLPINCGAIPETLIDSELFGHEKGSFTGAMSQKKGVFERGNRGTVFLDEVGEMPLNVQIRMLRILQEKKIWRVGGSESIDVDIRIIAATHQNIDELIACGKFRSDLWFRLGVFSILMPPLRERKEDIPLLVDYFLDKKSKQMNIPAPLAANPEVLAPLLTYDWPGNVRELENVVERALILCRDQPMAFHRIVGGQKEPLYSESENEPEENLNLGYVMANHLKNVLKMTRGRINGPEGAAEKLGVHPVTLRHRMKKLGVPYGRNSMKKKVTTNATRRKLFFP